LTNALFEKHTSRGRAPHGRVTVSLPTLVAKESMAVKAINKQGHLVVYADFSALSQPVTTASRSLVIEEA